MHKTLKGITLCLLAILNFISANAETYTIDFNKGTTYGTSIGSEFPVNISTLCQSGSEYISSIDKKENCKYSSKGCGIRLALSNGIGTFTFTICDDIQNATVKEVIVYASKVSGNTSAELTVKPSGTVTAATTYDNTSLAEYSTESAGSENYALSAIAINGTLQTLTFSAPTRGYVMLHRVDIITEESSGSTPTPSFSISDMTAAVGDVITPSISTDNTDGYSVSYVSSDEGIVSVNDGILTAVGGGTATITATMGATEHFTSARTTFCVTIPTLSDRMSFEGYAAQIVTMPDAVSFGNAELSFAQGDAKAPAKYYVSDESVHMYWSSATEANALTVSSKQAIYMIRIESVAGYEYEGTASSGTQYCQGTTETVWFSDDDATTAVTFIVAKECHIKAVTVYYDNGSADVAVSGAGYSSYYNSAKRYIMPEGCEGYVVNMSSGSFSLEKAYAVGDVVPAGEALIIKGASGNYSLVFNDAAAAGSLAAEGKNSLMGTDEDTDLESDATSYFYALSLGASGDVSTVGLYWMNDEGSAFTNKAHKAYLKLPKSAAEARAFMFHDLAAGILMRTAKETVRGAYDISGTRAAAGVRLVIANGKKYIGK